METQIKDSKTLAILECCIVLSLIALVISLVGDESARELAERAIDTLINSRG
jgi:hypothetical protein